MYPATSENNLLFELRQQKEHHYRPHFSHPRNYLGFRSLERSDAVSVTSADEHHVQSFFNHQSRHQEVSDSNASSGSSKTKAKKRSQSFLVKSTRPQYQYHSNTLGHTKTTHRKQQGDEYVYDRFERKFVRPESGMRHGHSDLRLDRGFKQPHFAAQFQPSKGKDNYHERLFSKEITHHQEQIEPQRFKTIIFLSGN